VVDSFFNVTAQELSDYLSRDYVVEDPETGDLVAKHDTMTITASPIGRIIRKSGGMGYQCEVCGYYAVPLSGLEEHAYQQDTHKQRILDILEKELNDNAKEVVEADNAFDSEIRKGQIQKQKEAQPLKAARARAEKVGRVIRRSLGGGVAWQQKERNLRSKYVCNLPLQHLC
jgi:hypothetical protein